MAHSVLLFSAQAVQDFDYHKILFQKPEITTYLCEKQHETRCSWFLSNSPGHIFYGLSAHTIYMPIISLSQQPFQTDLLFKVQMQRISFQDPNFQGLSQLDVLT